MTAPPPPQLDYHGRTPKLPDTRSISTAAVFSFVAMVIAVTCMLPLLRELNGPDYERIIMPCFLGFLAIPVALSCGVYGIVTTSLRRHELRGGLLAWVSTGLTIAMLIASITAQSIYAHYAPSSGCLNHLAPFAGLLAFLRR